MVDRSTMDGSDAGLREGDAGLPAGPVTKICGLTRSEDVVQAWELGAWGVGFVFAPSPRRITPAAAYAATRDALQSRKLAEGPGGDGSLPGDAAGQVRRDFPMTIGVFTDASVDEIAAVVREADLDGVQLHRSAGPGGRAVRAALVDRGRPPLVIQAVPVDAAADDASRLAEAVASASAEADVVLLDTSVAGRFGGTGATFPWGMAWQSATRVPLLIAGGIGPQNVQPALLESGAWGVDVSSGIERSPGVKDPERMRELFVNVSAVSSGGAWTRARAGSRAGPGAILALGADPQAGGADRPQEG